MKKIIFSSFFLFFTLAGFAQQQGQDTVYFKNGSQYIGKISLLSSHGRLEIKTTDNTIHYFWKKDVFKISKSYASVIRNYTGNDDIYPTKIKSEHIQTTTDTVNKSLNIKTLDKSFLILDGSYGIGITKTNDHFHVAKFDLIGSYNISKDFNFGVGTGYRNYVNESASAKVIPLYADLRYLILSHKCYNFLVLDLGYSADVTDGITPLGYYVNPSFNMAFKTQGSFLILLGIGYEIQNISSSSQNINNLYLSVGFML